MHFTQEDYKKIENWLLKNSVKDSEFQEALPLNGSEIVVITQNGHNRNMTVQELSNKVLELGVSDFINVSDNFNTYGISLIEAISLIPFHLRKKGVVITFCNTENNWEIYQFTGVLNQWNNITLWNDIFNIERYAVNSLLPDEEDTTRTEIDKNGNSYLKLKDKEYNPLEFSGYGKKTLRKKIVTVKTSSKSSKRINILEGSVFKDSNTIYEIKYDFDLNNSTVTLPDNCILLFNGGKISNGKLNLNNTLVYPLGIVKEDVLECTTAGNFKEGQMFFDKEQGQLSIWDGTSWKSRANYKVVDNKLNETLDGGKTWTPVSDYISANFRWSPENTIQINRTGKEEDWEDLSYKFANNVFIKGYVASYFALPSNPSLGDIYMVGSGAPYTMFVYTSDGWVDNGSYTSIAAGVVQTTGTSTTEVMSQKAVTDKLTEFSEEINNYETKATDITPSFVEEKTLFYKWGNTTYIWAANNDYYWRLYKVEAGETLLLRKKAERGTFMAVECDLADFVVGGKLGNLVIEQNAPLGDYTYDNTSADTKYVAVLYKYYSYIYFEVFLTETISIADKVRELEDAAKPITTERIADGAVTIEKTDFVEVKSDAQLFDKDTMAIDDAWYQFDNNHSEGVGGYAKFEVNQYTGEYTAIKIPMAKISNVVVSQPKGVVYSYFAVDADMKVLGYAIPNSSINTGMSIAIPDGCVYLLISAKSYVADSFMVNEGTEVLPYQEFELATFVNGIKLTAQTEKDVAKLYLPKVLHAVVGDTLQVFYRGLMSVVNPYGYDILLTCKKGKQFPRYFEYTPTTADIGETTFAVTLKDEDGNMLESKECKLVTKAAPSNVGAINIACFGDSLTTDGTWCAEAYRRLTATNGNPIGLGLNNIKFVGKKDENGAGYFGEGGWRWSHYVTEGAKAYRFEVSNVNTLSVGSKYTNNGSTFTIQEINVTNGSGNILCSASGANAPLASGTLTLSQGGGDSSISYSSYEIAPTNPLWDASKGKMSFIPYANEFANGKLDVVYVLLGWNDVHRESYPYPTMMANCKTFIDTLHSEFPNAKMKLMGLQVCSINGGMGANYGAGDDYSDTYGTIRRLMKLNLAYKELAESAEYSSFVEYVDIASQFDSEYNMPSAETKVNTRSSLTERRGTNGVHPSYEGYMQIADVVYRNIIANL